MNPAASPPNQLDKDSPIPLYHQLKSILLERVKQGLWKNNDQLPTEDALGAEFGVSKATVRQALHALAQAGVVRRVLEQRLVPATDDLAEKLQVAAGAELFQLRRLRLAGGEPMGVQSVHIPGD